MALELTKIQDLMDAAKSGDRRSLSQLLTAIQSGEKIRETTSDVDFRCDWPSGSW